MGGTQGSIALSSAASTPTSVALGNATVNTTLTAENLDGYDMIVITQTTAGITYSTPATTKPDGTRRIIFNAAGSAHGFSLNTASNDDTGNVVMPSFGQEVIAVGGAWYAVGTAQAFLARGEYAIADIGAISSQFFAHNLAIAATATTGSGWAAYPFTFAKRPPNDRYKVNVEFRGFANTPNTDPTVTWSIRDKTNTGFTVYARETLGVFQALRMDLTITE